jgi:hypothetical protein
MEPERANPMKHLGALERQFQLARQCGEFTELCRQFLIARGSWHEAVRVIEDARVPARVASVIKAATSAMTLSSLADFKLMISGFAAALVNRGAFDFALANGMKIVPLSSTVGSVSIGSQAFTVAEGSVKPVSRLSISSGVVEPFKVVALIVFSNELLRMGGEDVQALMQRDLMAGVAKASDEAFINIATNGVAVGTSTGSTSVAFRNDLASMLSQVQIDASSQLFVLTTPAIAKNLSAMGGTSTSGQAAFPNLGPLGGEIAQGLPLIVSDAMSAGLVALIDASGFAGNALNFELSLRSDGTLQLDSNPDSPPGGGVLMSLWQYNLSGLNVERWIGCERRRSNAVALVQNSNNYGAGFSPP